MSYRHILLYNNEKKETSAGHENKSKSQKKAFNNSIHSNTPSRIVSESLSASMSALLEVKGEVREGHMTALYAE